MCIFSYMKSTKMRIRKFKRTKDNLYYYQFLDMKGTEIGRCNQGFATKEARNNSLQHILELATEKKNFKQQSKGNDQNYFELLDSKSKVVFKSNTTTGSLGSRIDHFSESISAMLSDREKADGGNVYAGTKGIDDYKPLSFYSEGANGVKNGFSKIEADGQYYFCYSKSGNVILMSQGYTSAAGRDNGIASVEKNMSLPERFQTQMHENGKYYFNLIAGNNQEIATSVWYEDEDALRNAVSKLTDGRVILATKESGKAAKDSKKKEKEMVAEGSYGQNNITYQIFKSANEKYYFTFKNKTGKTLLLNSNVTGFDTAEIAQSYVDGVIKHGGDKALYEDKTTKNGKYYCYLKNPDGENIAKSFFYGTKGEMNKGVALLLKEGGSATSAGIGTSGAAAAGMGLAGAGAMAAGGKKDDDSKELKAEKEAVEEKNRIETEKKAKQEAEARKQEEEVKAREEKARKDQEAKQKKEQEEARVREEAKAKEEKIRKEKEEAKAKEEVKAKEERIRKEKAEAKIKEDRIRKEKEEAKAKAERIRKEKEAKAKDEKLRKEKEAKVKADRALKEKKAQQQVKNKKTIKKEKKKETVVKLDKGTQSNKGKSAAASSSFFGDTYKDNDKGSTVNTDHYDDGNDGGGCFGMIKWLFVLGMIGLLIAWLYMNYFNNGNILSPASKDKTEAAAPVAKVKEEAVKPMPKVEEKVVQDSAAIKAAETKRAKAAEEARLAAAKKKEADEAAAAEKAKKAAEDEKRRKEAAARAERDAASQASTGGDIFEIPDSRPRYISELGRNPQFGDSRSLSPQQFYDKLNDRYQSNAMDRSYLDYLYKRMGYANGWSDANASQFSDAQVNRGQEGILGFGSYHGYGYYKLNVSDDDLSAFRIKAATGCDVHFMKRCGNYMYFCD